MMKIKVLRDIYPRIYQVQIVDKTNYFRTIFIFESPVKNCQTFSISGIQDFIDFTSDEIKSFFQHFLKRLKRKQFLADCRIEYKNDILNKLNPVCKNIIETEYTSTNNSAMCLLLCQLKKL
jgi:uncharacterized protein YqgQ